MDQQVFTDVNRIMDEKVKLDGPIAQLEKEINPWKVEIIAHSQQTGFDLKANLN